MTMKRNTGRQSPYRKYRKAEYQYSEAHQQWKAAVMRNDRGAIAIQGQRHSRMFGLAL
jgi:hypothetical protein